MFTNAKSLNTPEKANGKKKERKSVAIAGVEELAHLSAAAKAIEAAKEVLMTTISTKVKALFFKDIKESNGGVPESFNGTEGPATANFQLKKRATNSALNEEEIAILRKYKIEPKFEVITPELFAINPAYAADAKLLEKVEKALAKLDLPEDFIVKQEQKSKYVVDDATLATAFKVAVANDDDELIDITTTLAAKPTLDVMIPEEVAKTIQKILGAELEEEKAAKPATKPAAKTKKAPK